VSAFAWVRTVLAAVCGAGALACLPAAAQDLPVPVPGRGALLYETHCKACHDEQLHWRDQRVARDWPGLKLEVARWQAAARLNWSEADIVAVARHLNETVYHLPQNSDRLGGLPPTLRSAGREDRHRATR
jgi:mono/diheme cytochrome c family protein